MTKTWKHRLYPSINLIVPTRHFRKRSSTSPRATQIAITVWTSPHQTSKHPPNPQEHGFPRRAPNASLSRHPTRPVRAALGVEALELVLWEEREGHLYVAQMMDERQRRRMTGSAMSLSNTKWRDFEMDWFVPVGGGCSEGDGSSRKARRDSRLSLLSFIVDSPVGLWGFERWFCVWIPLGK